MAVTTQSYRYQLPKKAIKADCPQCGPRHRKTLSRYVDSRTEETLPEQYGRCDRESNCGYHISPYHKTASGLSYADEVYQTERENKPSTMRREPFRRKPLSNTIARSTAKIYAIPDAVFKQSAGHYERNQFAQLLQRQFGEVEANQLLQRFQIGTSAHWPGACVFWLKDEQHRVRAGQVVLFADDWHKAHYTDQEGTRRVCISSVSHGLLRRHRQQEQPAPDWLTDYHKNAPRWPILFGLHQLATAPIDQPIAIVEAPKTAVVCSALMPGFVWMAVGALSYLNAERLAPLHGRAVMLFPDLSKDGTAFARWSKVADDLNAEGYRVSVSDMLERGATDEQKEQGLDLADFLLNAPLTQNIVPSVQPPATRVAFPVAPLNYDAAAQLVRIRWCVLPEPIG